MKRKQQEDDFILTISDGEGDEGGLDGDGDGEDVAAAVEDVASDGLAARKDNAKSTQGQNKRKRGMGGEGADDSRPQRKKSKKHKDQTSPMTRDGDGDEGSDVEEPQSFWGARDDDDGAMDSDFEFQLEAGGGEDEAMGGFDGWGFDEKRRGLEDAGGEKERRNGGGGKRGVDIDEIIRRRRGRVKAKQDDGEGEEIDGEGSGDEEWEDENEQEGEEEEEDDDDAEPMMELLDDEDDEFMAEDGFGMGVGSDEEESGDEGVREDSGGDEENRADLQGDSSDDDSVATPVPHPDDLENGASSAEDNDDDQEEAARREAFFAPEEDAPKSKKARGAITFQHMSLSRPIHRGLAAVGFSQPTPIQAKTIPVALLGKDVVGGAVTGSGKTAAFIVPILERLLYRPKKVPTSRVAILMPTRELAIQCHAVATKLASYTDIKFCLAVGGLSLKVQEAELRLRPDVIIATPGRFIDHMRNSASFTVDTLEILVLDEADRMLEDGFADELNEILTTIPKSRQTMLFSATMTSSVDRLIRVGLNRPVRLLVDAQKQTVGTLVQEFVRLRPGREGKRMGYLLYLCSKVYTDRAIVFFRQKKEAHRARVIFGLSGLRAAELHGSMSQEQRITSVEAFRDGKVSFLLATDLASRGLDIKGVNTVINYEAPQSHEIYLHRVGRTARAGRSGRACTLAAEADRKVVKAAVKSGRAQGAKIVSRVIEAAEADAWASKVEAMQEEIDEILVEEKEDKQLAQVEMQVKRGENIIVHEDEIKGRPKRTWFESEREKRLAKKAGRAELNGPESVVKKKKEGKLSNKDKKKLDDSRARLEGKVWKKGRAERAGKGALAQAKQQGKKKKGKGGKPVAKTGGRGKISNKRR